MRDVKKKSFWLSSNPRNRIRRRERSHPPPQARDPRQPRRFPGTRRPVSSEAAGRRGGVPAQRKRTSRPPGHPPRRRSPFPSVSSSSSSFVSRGFPLVPVASVSVPVFGSRAGLSGPLFRPFDRVQVSENRAAPELSFRLRSRGCHAFSPARLSVRLAFASLLLGPGQRRTASRHRRLRSRSTSRSRPPVLLVCCSFRSWFVSRSFVWFRPSVQLNSVQPVSFVRSFVHSVPLCSFSVRFRSVSSVSF